MISDGYESRIVYSSSTRARAHSVGLSTSSLRRSSWFILERPLHSSLPSSFALIRRVRARWLVLTWRQVRNALTALLLAGGVPLMEWGDEYGHTRRGAARAASSAETSNFFRWDAVADTPQVSPPSPRPNCPALTGLCTRSLRC